MSKYTTELRFICESESGLKESKGFNDIQEILEQSAPKIFNFYFPIFDEDYRLPLEIKILRHFYTREICEETVGLWKLRLQDKLNIIMPYYNKMYESELLTFDPFHDVSLTRTSQKDAEGQETTEDSGSKTSSGTITGSETTSDDGTHWDLYSDTPQGGINGITNDNDSVSNNTYLTNARKITDANTGSSTTTQSNSNTENISNEGTRSATNTEEYLENITGKQGSTSYSKMLEEYRETFLNIDRMIIEELNDLFFGLW